MQQKDSDSIRSSFNKNIFLTIILLFFICIVSSSFAYETASAFRYPLNSEGWYLSQDFCVWNSSWGGYHLGEDCVVNNGEELPVYAPANGIVKHNASRTGYGRVVIVEHHLSDGSYVCTVHGHMRAASIVAVGTEVSKGDLIGYLSNDYNENGGYNFIHLHFGVSAGAYSSTWIYYGYGSNCNNWYDPTDFVNEHSLPQNNTLIRVQGGIEVYWLQNDIRYHVLSEDIAQAMTDAGLPGWTWPTVNEFPQSTIDQFPEGPEFIESNSGSNGLLIRETGTSPVYVMVEGKCRWIRSLEALDWKGSNWDPDVIEVAPQIISNYVPTQGDDIWGLGEGETNTTTKNSFINAYTLNENSSYCTSPSSWKGWPGTHSECLKFPKTTVGNANVSGYSGISGKYQTFDYGIINYTSQYGAFEVHGAIFERYKSLNYSGSQLGFPISDEYQWGSYRRSDFEGGYIYWNSSNDQTYVVYNDTTPPSPNPMTWATQPYAASSTSISMVATTATDSGSPPVSYLFDFVSSPTGGSGGSDSSWQSSTSYTDTGLQANHQYGYRVKARDSASTPNETDYSSTVYKYTHANAPGTSSFSNVNQTSIRANWTANGNPSGTEYYCENTSAVTNSGWTTNTYWNSTGLTCGTSYTFRVMARNGDGTQTGWTILGSQSTNPCLSIPTVTTTAASSITSNSASSGGNVTNDGGAAVTARGVCWSTSANPTTSDSHTSDGTGTGSFTSSITGLSPNTPYHVRAYATNSEGTGYGSEETFTTKGEGGKAMPWLHLLLLGD